jgi:endonuclease-3
MSSPTRTAQFNKLHRVLKKHYRPVLLDPTRSVLEQMLLACCLENAHHDAAEEAFLGLIHNFFDWNEVRVSTVRELAEVMPRIPDSAGAAHRVKRVLQSIFESTYSFELEGLRKMNLGPATEKLKAVDGTTNYTVGYVVQAALGGHAIPVDEGTLQALRVVELVTQEDQQAGVVPGLERAIPKSKGPEFASLLHQLGADFVANPYAPRLREILLEIDPDARDRLPRRRARRTAETADAPSSQHGAPSGQAGAEEAPPDDKQAVEAGNKRGGAKKKAEKRKTAGDKKKADEPTKTGSGKKKAAAAGADDAPEEKQPAESKGKEVTKQEVEEEKSRFQQEGSTKKSSTSGLSKRKPR